MFFFHSGWSKLRTHAMANASKGKVSFVHNTRVLAKLMQERKDEQVREEAERAERERNAMLYVRKGPTVTTCSSSLLRSGDKHLSPLEEGE